MRSLGPDERALWARVTATIQPLSRDRNDPPPIEDEAPNPKRRAINAPLSSSRPSATGERRGPGTTLDSSWDRRLRAGNIDPDRVVDLHGMSLDGAWRAIDRALEQSVARGDRVLLLITGHRRADEPPIRRGAIRAAVHDWLAASRHSGHIAAIRGAHRRHGGGGSLYIVLRRRASPR